MDDDLLTALYHAASSEEPDTMDGPSLCDYYQRREETEQTRRALVDAVGDEVDVDSYGVAMECQGFVNGFKLALEVSAYSLTGLWRAFEPLLHDGSSVITMTYHGSTKIIPGYNVMGVAKAALEASVRYLAYDLGPKGVRVNALSAGPIKTLAASAVSSLKDIFNHVEAHAPLRRNVSTTDVGGAAVFLASELSHAVTGEIIYVDSGFNQIGISA